MKNQQKVYKKSSLLDSYSKRTNNADLKDIHKTLVNDRLKGDFENTYNNKHDSSYYVNLNKKIRSRSKSQFSESNNYSYERLRKQKTNDTPINIFISVEKLNKMKINNNDNKDKTKRSVISSLGKKKYPNQVEQPMPKFSIKKEIFQSTTRQKQSPYKKKSLGERRFKTLEDEDLNRREKQQVQRKDFKVVRQNKQLRKSQEREQQQIDPANEKLNYEELKYDQERFPPGFKKHKLLGRGGFSLVWIGLHRRTKTNYAVKQILTRNKYQTHLKEIWFCTYFFAKGKPREQFKTHPGVNNLLMMYDYEIAEIDTWIIYELCDGSLGSMLYDLYKEEGLDQEAYLIKYKPMYLKMRESPTYLKNLIIEIAKTLDLLSEHNIVHSDLKTENILIQQNRPNADLKSPYVYKLIDYGSSFAFTNLKQYTLATPEYMCPQLLNYILYQNKQDYVKEMLRFLKDYNNISAIDIWGLGCVVLEIINGLPLWISGATKVFFKGEYIQKVGLFSVQNRSFKRIIDKQLQVVNNIEHFFSKENYSGVILDQQLRFIIKRMLDLNPSTRIKPRQILSYFKVSMPQKKLSLIDLDS